jgi:NifU-like protein involved in Fe-S cluster formation
VASSASLYTPQVLALATSLADFPLGPEQALRGSARSQTCGSTIEIGLRLTDSGRIATLGLRAQACAIGQAAAAIFATGAVGLPRSEIAAGLTAIESWLAGTADLPNWPDISIISATRNYPARHGAITLAWKAALDALPTG